MARVTTGNTSTMNSNGQELVLSGTKEKALELLGAGIASSLVAQSIGVSEGYISQLLADEDFLKQVVERKFQHLQKHNARDAAYDTAEDTVLKALQSQLGMIFDPMKLAKILQVLNAAKRRGAASPDAVTQQSTVITLIMPTKIVERFSVVKDVDNRIIEAGDQKLVTMQSGTLMDRLRAKNSLTQNEQGTGNETTDVNATTCVAIQSG
jgi:hypothetical protein